MKRFIPIALAICLSAPAVAKQPAATAPGTGATSPLQMTSKAPIEISAAKSLEWNRKAHTYTARKEAIAKQGQFQVSADTLVAKYSEGKTAKKGALGGINIYELTAENNVVIQNPPYTAYGDHAVYEVATNEATLTGSNLRITTPTESVTAKDKIAFFGQENRLTAVGGAVATKAPDTLKADVLDAYFQKNAQGKMAMNKVTADGHVVIITDKETVYGDKGVYDLPKQKAVLTGKVKIFQDKNWLEGTRAEVDMNTGISQLFAEGGKDNEGRVKGVFYPKAQDNKPDNTSNTDKSDTGSQNTQSAPQEKQ